MSQPEKMRDRVFARRALILAGAKLGLFGALVARLYYLQIVEADRYKVLAERRQVPGGGRIAGAPQRVRMIPMMPRKITAVGRQADDAQEIVRQVRT